MSALLAAAWAWVIANPATVIAWAVALASAVVRVTPTTKDNAALARVVRVLEWVSLARSTPARVAEAVTDREVDAYVRRLKTGEPIPAELLAELREAAREVDP